MIKRIFCTSMVLLIVLLCSACSLAKPEVGGEAASEDRFVGVYIMNWTDDQSIYDLEWTEDGIEKVEKGLSVEEGHLMIEEAYFHREILPAVYSQESHSYEFPGLKGFALFAAEVKDPSQEYGYTVTCCDLAGGSSGFHTRDIVGEDGEPSGEYVTDYELSGTLYVGDLLSEDNYWRLLKVFQKPDGTVYLDGTGDAYGGGGTMTLEEKLTRTVNGQKVDMGTTKVSVTIEEAKEPDRGVIYWYDTEGKLLSTETLNLQQVSELAWPDGASWLVYEEYFEEEVTRTLIERGIYEEPASLEIITVNEDGIGEIKTVEIK